jgi:hypothetical protein
MKELEKLINMINSYPSDIKAEVLMADLIQEGFAESDFIVFFDSLFKRKYSSDILKAEKVFINDYQELLGIFVARDGLYDLLPEGLFHASDSALTSRKESKIEEEARKFFRPFENEFFHQRVQLELEERFILQKFHDNSLDDFFLRFWKIDQSLPRDLVIKLIAMLPFLKEIIGDFKMTANCLGSILGEEVFNTFRYTNEPPVAYGKLKENDEFSLGQASLGVDFITGGHLMESCKLVRFSIGPLKRTGIEPYLENGEIARFIECFFSYIMPMEIETEFELLMPEDRQEFILNPENQSIMGYSTII